MMSEEIPRKTPLHACHVEAGARLVDFSGWEMPVQYRGVIEEHLAVRERAGLFDVSHMGEVRVRGGQSEAFLDSLTPNHVAGLRPGRAHYSGLLTESGTYLDDILIYRMDREDFLVVVNASNVDKDFEWIQSHASGDVEVTNVSDEYALLALQGPRAVDILTPLTSTDLGALRYYSFAVGEVDGHEAIISRTGYTGEDGFELYTAPQTAADLWTTLLEQGEAHGIVPAGLGARDTLRLEAAMALYGHELDEDTTPWEAGLNWVVKMAKGDFIGREALERQQAEGVGRCLVGFEVTSRGIAREGHAILVGDDKVGAVSSGTFSPTFEKALGMAYVAAEVSEPGTEIKIEVRKRLLDARIVEMPFYRRSDRSRS
jgi:aminomethyltransferase